MDEYFCPNCGAILNNQFGFNPDVGTWTCTECGKTLMDDDVYDGDTYEGVAWFCDNCGALLNKQYGFSDSYSSWTCTECYHSNSINENEIYESEEEYKNRIECPNCKADLNKQWLYSSCDDDWECTECGAKLHRNYSFEEYSIVEDEDEQKEGCCPNCGEDLENQFGYYPEGRQTCYCGATLYFCKDCHELLNTQDGFYAYCDEWTCTECGTDNEITEDEEGNYASSNYSGQSYDYSYSGSSYTSSEIEKSSSNTKPKKQKSKKWIKLKIFAALLVIVIGVCAVGYYEFTKLIPIGHSNDTLEGLRYTVVVEKLKESGFTNVRTKELSDLTISREDEEDLVTEIKFGWFTSFDETTNYPSNLGVTVVYHTVEIYSPALSSKDAKGMNYEEVIDAFEDAGFTNIKTEIEYDIVTGWLTEDGEVKSVTINGDKKFDSNDKYRLDAEIIITYHTLAKNKPKK